MFCDNDFSQISLADAAARKRDSVKHQYRCALQGIRFIYQPGGETGERKLECGQRSWDRAHHDCFSDSLGGVFSFGMVPFWGKPALRGIGGQSAVL
jgi:hypothetical protein